MKTLTLFVAAAAMAGGALTQALQAELITGGIGVTGGMTYDTSSPATATAVTSWINPLATITAGTFAAAPYAVPNGAPVIFTSQNWNFNTSTPMTNFWNVGGFKFELLSSRIAAQSGTPGLSGYAVVAGTGVVSGNGFTATAFSWSFTSQDPPAGGGPSWTFSALCTSNNTNGAPVLLITAITHATVLSWSDPTFTLQSAPGVAGMFTNIPGATSPYTNTVTFGQQFFRLNQ
jgi:hypothetical protein